MQWSDVSATINVNELTKKVRIAAQPRLAFSQACTPPTGEALGKGAGDTGQFVYCPDVDTEGGQLDESEDIPSTGLTPIKKTYTLYEYGNSIRYTGKFKDLSRLDMEDVHMKSLENDYQKVINGLAYTAAKATNYKVALISTGNEFDTDGAVEGAANADLSLSGLGFIGKNMRAQNIPYWDGESYLGIIHPFSTEALGSDSTLSTLLSRDSGRASLNNEIGRVKQFRLVEDNHKLALIGSTAFYESIFMGADAVVREEAVPIEIRKEDRDYGRFLGLAWYAILSVFKVLDYSTHSREHVVHTTTAP